MPKSPAPLQLIFVPANDILPSKRRRNPVDPRLIPLARLLARQAASSLWNPAPTGAVNDNSLPEIVRNKRIL